MKEIAENISDEQDFDRNLDAILIPRTVGSRNHDRVREHIKRVMSNSGWSVEEDRFSDQTPLGKKQFTNIISTQDPSAARRLVIACHYDSKIKPAGVYATDSAVPCARSSSHMGIIPCPVMCVCHTSLEKWRQLEKKIK